MKIAIIGSGISGLGAARALAARHEVDLYEAQGHVGGHTHTVDVPADAAGLTGATIPVDTGFIIYNERTYPLLSRMFAELGVATRGADMSFSASCTRCGLEYGSAGVGALFAQPERLTSLRHYRLLAEIVRFFQAGRAALHDDRVAHLTLGEFLDRRRIARDAVDHFVVPMGAAIWSTDARRMLDFPVAMFLRFYANHGMLGLTGAPRWRTVVGGSKVYVRALLERTRMRVLRESPVERLERDAAGVTVVPRAGAGQARRYDRVVVATHSDQALALLGDGATGDERRLLGAIRYVENEVWLHCDERFLPTPRARASWNYRTADCRAPEPRVGATYWMNRLQGIAADRPLLVTLNPTRPIAPDKVIRRLTAAHPLYDFAALRAQRQLPRLAGTRHTYFAGAYFGYGFHEDGLRSGVEAAAALERDLARGSRESAA